MLEVCDALHYCWSNPILGKKQCTSPCINTISPLTVKKHLKALIGEQS